jgi:hypothetical protein
LRSCSRAKNKKGEHSAHLFCVSCFRFFLALIYFDEQKFKGSVIKPGGEIPSKPSLIMTLKDSVHFFDKTLDCLQQAKNPADNKPQVPTDPTPKHQP